MKKGDKVTYLNAFNNRYKGTIVGFELKKVPYRKTKVKYVKILSDNTHEITSYLPERIQYEIAPNL